MTEPPSKAAAARTSGRQRRAVGAPKPPPVPVAAVEPPPAKPVLSHASIAGSKASHDFAQIGRGAEPSLTPTEVRNCGLRCPLRRNLPTVGSTSVRTVCTDPLRARAAAFAKAIVRGPMRAGAVPVRHVEADDRRTRDGRGDGADAPV